MDLRLKSFNTEDGLIIRPSKHIFKPSKNMFQTTPSHSIWVLKKAIKTDDEIIPHSYDNIIKVYFNKEFIGYYCDKLIKKYGKYCNYTIIKKTLIFHYE